MRLSIFERVLLLNIFPSQRGDIVALKAIREFREDCSPTPQERKACSLKIDKRGGVTWDKSKAKDREIIMDDFIKERIALRLTELSERRMLKEEHVPLYEKFAEE